MELDFVRWLRQRTAPTGSVAASIPVGIGDDAAVLVPHGPIVVTTDMLMEGVDFENAPREARRIGRKSLAVNLSDLAAMAATPLAAFVAVALPRRGGRALAEQLYEGMLELAGEFGLTIAGGDTNSWDGPLVVSVTAVGQLTERGALLRSGARPGDHILVTGQLGGSILGRHFDFRPRVRECLWLHERFALHAGIDISDGLALDLARLAEASGCGAVVDLNLVPISQDADRLTVLRGDGVSPLDHALGDGEDFELVIAAEPTEADKILAAPDLPLAVTRIGRFVDQPGLWQTNASGKWIPLSAKGYEHRMS